MQTDWKVRVLTALLALLTFAADRVVVAAQEVSPCFLPLTSIRTIRGWETANPDLLEQVNGWQLDESRYEEAIGRPVAMLYGATDGTRAGRRYFLIYDSRSDSDSVVVFRYTFERMFGDHADADLHNHPDCGTGTLPRAVYDAVLSAMPPGQEAQPPTTEAEREAYMVDAYFRQYISEAKIACATVEAWGLNRPNAPVEDYTAALWRCRDARVAVGRSQGLIAADFLNSIYDPRPELGIEVLGQ